MKKMHINKKFASLALAGTMLLTGCSITKNKTEEPVTTRTVDIRYDIAEGTKMYIIKDTTTKGEESNTTISTVKEPMQLCEYEITRIIPKEDINIRETANQDSNVIKTVPAGMVLQSVYQDGDWYRVIIDSEIGYVKSEYVYEAIDKKGQKVERESINRDNLDIEIIKCVEADESVNIRSDATAESEKVGLLESGQKIEILKRLDNGWYEVNYNGGNSYVNGEYVHEVTEEKIISPFIKKVMFTNDSNIYTNKDKTEIVDTAPTYEVAFVYSEIDDMYLAEVNNKIVYINKYDTRVIDDKVVIVDISDQNAKQYDGNDVLVDTPVVTGKSSTPTYKGYFEIYYIERNVRLMDKYFVDYWMAFDEGRGLHDAEYHTDYDEDGNYIRDHGWRSSDEFGGQTYLYNGSHGCVNLPNAATKEIYKNVTKDYQENDHAYKVLVKQ